MLRDLFQGRLPEAVLFDLDGTLVDSVPDLAEGVDRMLAQLGRPAAGEAAVRQWVGNGARVLVERALAGGFATEQLVTEDVDVALALFLEAYADCCSASTRLYPGVLKCLTALQDQGVAMGCVTNKPGRFTGDLLRAMELDGFFGGVVSGDTCRRKKPDPEPLLHCCELLAVDQVQTLMVGDSGNDILAARNAGMPVVAVSYGYNHGRPIEEDEPDCVLDTLAQLVA